MVKMNTMRILISLFVNLDRNLRQHDIKNASLNGDLEEIYMHVPPGYENTTSKNQVCRLKKALHGLKQSPRGWFGKFIQTMNLARYKQCKAYHKLFFQHYPSRGVITCYLYLKLHDY